MQYNMLKYILVEKYFQECLIDLIIPYIMQIFNIHKQAEFTKNNGHVKPAAHLRNLLTPTVTSETLLS